ncbi:MAG TPA: lysophospholipid acyltransferase family protein [Candidatus Baltobacteraceae bacterium]|nr:lysophospholipid acyltransferase family protein [Candidatus Baltobacteraceae bacterium]
MKILKFPTVIVAPSYAFWRLVTLIVAWKNYRLRAFGTENVPRKGPVIIAANHISWLDPPLVGAYCPRRIVYMAKRELFEIPWLGMLIATMGAFPVDREGNARAAIKHSLEILKAGGCLGIFPEGGRNVEGDRQAQTGVALLASLSGAPVVPVAVIGSERAKEHPHIRVVYGKPLALPAGRKATREDLARFTDEIMAAVAHLRATA